jgi:hypothetical protein
VCGKVNAKLGAGDGARAFCVLGDLSKEDSRFVISNPAYSGVRNLAFKISQSLVHLPQQATAAGGRFFEMTVCLRYF